MAASFARYDVDRPLFVIGAVRSGLSAIFERIAAHEQVAWVSNHSSGEFRRRGFASDAGVRRNRLYDAKLFGGRLFEARVGPDRLGSWLRQRAPGLYGRLPFPTEPWSFWRHHLSQFQIETNGETNARPPLAEDLDEVEVAPIREAVLAQMRLQGRVRFASYFGIHPRIDYLSRAFPEARFIHVVRDGRAVCESHLRMIREAGWASERKNWPEEWPDEWRSVYADESRSPLALAAMRWMGSVDLAREEARSLPSHRFLEVAYEDFVATPDRVMEQVQVFGDLVPSKRVARFLRRVPPRDNNRKWREVLGAEQLAAFDRIVTAKRHRDLLRNDPTSAYQSL